MAQYSKCCNTATFLCLFSEECGKRCRLDKEPSGAFRGLDGTIDPSRLQKQKFDIDNNDSWFVIHLTTVHFLFTLFFSY